MSSIGGQRLASGAVLLRVPDPADAVDLAEQWADPLSQRWAAAPVPGPAAARSHLARMRLGWEQPDGPRSWVIEHLDAEAGTYAGYLTLSPRSHRTAEVDYGLHPRARGAHVMTTALRLACTWWFDSGGERVTWWAEAGNLESWRVARSCGFAAGDTTRFYLPQGPVDGRRAVLTPADMTRAA
ncbi:MAG: GNAT family N-acetyltransferase [Mobilicoccus sp.]|nr:GNAT family N-acetyltransferase [Mobilicoccus sp.]